MDTCEICGNARVCTCGGKFPHNYVPRLTLRTSGGLRYDYAVSFDISGTLVFTAVGGQSAVVAIGDQQIEYGEIPNVGQRAFLTFQSLTALAFTDVPAADTQFVCDVGFRVDKSGIMHPLVALGGNPRYGIGASLQKPVAIELASSVKPARLGTFVGIVPAIALGVGVASVTVSIHASVSVLYQAVE